MNDDTSDAVTHLLARAAHCRRQARCSGNPDIATAFQELAKGFEAAAALEAVRDRVQSCCTLH